jgi:hypothetical protein
MNVSLRPMSEADLPLVAGWLRLPQVARWWTRDTTAEAETASTGTESAAAIRLPRTC